MIDLSYLRAKPISPNFRHEKYYVKSGTEGNIVRNIYEGVDYEEFEVQRIEEFKKAIDVPLPSQWRSSDYLKMLVSADFQIPQAVKNLKAHLNWLQMFNQGLNETHLSSGRFYLFGIDKQQRPVIYIKQVDDSDFISLMCLFELVKRQILVPYFVEKWTVVIDLEYRDFDFYDMQQLDQVKLQSLMVNFCGNLNAILMLHSTIKFQQIVSLIPTKNQIHSKIQIITDDDITKYIATDQLEEKYGGECSNLTQFWPPFQPKVSEFLKAVTIDSIDEGQRKLLEFQGRSIRQDHAQRKQSQSINSHTSKMIQMQQSQHSQTHNSSISILKLQVHEENGNALIQEEIQMNEDDSFDDMIAERSDEVAIVNMKASQRNIDSCCGSSSCHLI